MKKQPLKCKSRIFKAPKDVEDYIRIWGLMDDIVHNIKNKQAIAFWERNCAPRDARGLLITLTADSLQGKTCFLTYEHLSCNRYWYRYAFEQDIRNYHRLYKLFSQVLNLKQ